MLDISMVLCEDINMMTITITYEEAAEWVSGHTDSDILDRAELEAAYEGLGFGPATEADYDCDLWSHCCAEVA